VSLLHGMLGHASAVSLDKVKAEFAPLLVDGEELVSAYKLIRDLFVFTNKRLILVDKQGLTGSKTEYQTIPYTRIVRFSKESAGLLDLDAELKIWIQGQTEPLKKEFKKDDSVNEIYKLLSASILK
jgi:hypothetical protein